MLFKTVHIEYLEKTFSELFGTVGGTLGLLVGFSILGSLEWMQQMVLKLWTTWSQKRRGDSPGKNKT